MLWKIVNERSRVGGDPAIHAGRSPKINFKPAQKEITDVTLKANRYS
jgi:hypothetical protein